jgi:hypothetical protein
VLWVSIWPAAPQAVMREISLLVVDSLEIISEHGGWYAPNQYGSIVRYDDPWEAERRSLAYLMGDMPVEDVVRSL